MEIEFSLDGEPVRCPEGLTVAAALWSLGRCATRVTARAGESRGLFCGMGVCFDCVAVINGRPGVRSCAILVRPGMSVATQHGVSALTAAS